MKTSNFKIYRGDKGVAFCLYPPMDWTGARFPALEPPRKLFFARKAEQITQEEFEKGYKEEILSKLDPEIIYNQLKDYVLLCWEPAIFDQKGNVINSGKGFCHRHLVSQWIFEKLNIVIKEWEPADEIPNNKSISLF
jgi:hypothetical protein